MTESGYLRLTAARVFDGASDRALEGGGVLLRGSTIERVGRLDDLRAPDGAPVETIDYGDATILPGFVDAHTHVTAPGDGTVGEGVGATAGRSAAAPGRRERPPDARAGHHDRPRERRQEHGRPSRCARRSAAASSSARGSS